jgi:hypothetical protein
MFRRRSNAASVAGKRGDPFSLHGFMGIKRLDIAPETSAKKKSNRLEAARGTCNNFTGPVSNKEAFPQFQD